MCSGLQNVHLEHVAVAESRGMVTLHIADELHAGHNTLCPKDISWTQATLKGSEEVAAESLDEIATRLKLARVDFIKMDIERGEFAALCGARNILERDRPPLLMEVGNKKAEEMLHGLGYSATPIKGSISNVLFLWQKPENP